MSKLTIAQNEFSYAFSILIICCQTLGYHTAYDDGYRSPRVFGEDGESKGYGNPRSLHKLRLAHDLIIRDVHGNVLGETAHSVMHDKWDKMGGNRRMQHDLNHYSWPWDGRL